MKTARLALIVLLVTAVLASCAKQDTTPPANSGEPTTTTTDAEVTTTTEAPVEAAVVTLEGSEYAYTFADGASTVPAGAVTVELDNTGVEEHQAAIVKLKPGKTIDDLIALGNDPTQLPTVLDAFGGPNSVSADHAGITSQNLEAGDYFFACFVPAADGVPHAAKGMLAPFTVEGEATETLEMGNDPISLTDYSFGFSADGTTTLSAGQWSIVNDGTQAHEAAIYAPADGKTVQDVIDYFSSPAPPPGPPPMTPAGGIGPENVGTFTDTELIPGAYVFVCFLPDPSDGAPHFVHGMIQSVTVE